MWAILGTGMRACSLAYTGGNIIAGASTGYHPSRFPSALADRGFVGWQNSLTGKYIIQSFDVGYATSFNPFEVYLTVSGGLSVEMGPMPHSVNGYPAWIGGGSHHIYHDGSGYVLRPKEYLGQRRPPEDDDDEDEVYWVTTSSAHPTLLTFEPKGAASGSCTVDTSNWEHWECDTMLGVYTPQNGASGNKTVGLPRWRSIPAGKMWVRRLIKDGNNWVYVSTDSSLPDIVYYPLAGVWVAGTYASPSGWWQSETEPSISTSATFAWTTRKDQEDPPEGDDFTITFDAYVIGDNAVSELLGEVAIWRY